MKPLAPNTLLQNRYLIVQLIGKGGMGEVYLAVDQRLGSAIAIKRTFFTEDDALGGAFEREARTLARLRHPVLPKVSDHFTENENQYLVMEHISGDDLSKRLESNKKPFPVNWVLFWADQLLDALNYLHSHEPPIIHRDIKPQNLKLTADNQIVLLDFGLAKDSVGQTKVTTTGSVVGYTPHYAPMEQIRGTGTNPKSDLYSLSATLYQLLTNNVPFDALTRADSLLNGVADPVQPIYEINKEVPRNVSEIILRGMSVSQEQRFSNAREMQKTLRDAYSSMQNQMASQTFAFNLQDVKADESTEQILDEKVLDVPVLDNYATIVNEPYPVENKPAPESPPFVASQPADDKTEVFNQTDFQSNEKPNEKPNDFDATMKIEDFKPLEVESNQSGIRTEVFLPNEISPRQEPEIKENKPPQNIPTPIGEATVPLIIDKQAENDKTEAFNFTPTDFTKPNNVPVNEDNFKTSGENFSAQPDYLKTDYIQNENPSQKTGEISTAATTTSPQQFVKENQTDNRNVNQFPPPPPQQQHQQQKKSGGKGLLIGVGLIALLLLLGGAAVGGWYVYKNYVAVQPTPMPTPEITPTLVTTPEITPEPTPAETNSQDTNNNSETDNTNSETGNSDNSNTDKTNTKVLTTNTPKPVQTANPTPVPRQTPVQQQIPRATPPPQVKKTPAPQSTPRRTDIIKP